MGTDATSTAYAAELQGIQLAAAMAKAEVDACACQKLIDVFADNQAAIRPADHLIKLDHLHRTSPCLHLDKTKLLHTASSICCGPL
jgi:predicted ATPase